MENIIIAGLFIGAIFYISKLILQSFKSNKGCASASCNKCQVVDFDIKHN